VSARARAVAFPAVLLGGALVIAEAVGLVTSRHRLLPPEVIADALLRVLPAALSALALVLVYRSARLINFAQGGIAVGSAIVFLVLQLEGVPYALCFAAGLASAIASGVLIDLVFLRRFANSPRLVATVVTIAGGQLIFATALLLQRWRFGEQQESDIGTVMARRLLTSATSPFAKYHPRWGVEAFSGDLFFAVGVSVVAIVALTVFFRRSRAGVAIRGMAENAEKVATLGIASGSLSTLVWALAGGLTGLATLTMLPVDSTSLNNLGATSSTLTLLTALAAAVAGRMESLPTTAAAAVALSVLTRAVYFSVAQGTVVEVVILVVLAVLLVFMRSPEGRAGSALTNAWAAAEEIRPVPPVLRDHLSVRAGRRWVFGIGLVVLLGYPFAMSPSQVFLGGTFAIYGIIVVSLVVLTGWGGQISLGQLGFVAVGASVGGGLASNGWPFLIAAVIGSVAGGVVAIVIGLPALRVRGLFLAVMTLGFSLVVADYVLNENRFPALVPATVPRPRLFFISFADDRAFYYLALAGLGLALFVAAGLRRTRTGRVLIAMRDNERGAQALGISLIRTRLVTFAISGALSAFAGVLLASQSRSVRASAFLPDLSIQIFLMAVIGGLGSVSGVLTGAIYLGCVELFLHDGGMRLFASGFGVICILLFFPAGFGGAIYAARDAFLRRIALREKIHVPSLLGDLRKLEGDENLVQLGEKAHSEETARRYEVDSGIREAGKSQRGKGWVYG
jgi:branched-chain amino acid transport system permease protein